MKGFEFWKWIDSFFLNPLRIIRKNLFNSIVKNKHYIYWNVLDFWCWEKPYKNLFKFDSYEGLDYPKTWHDNRKNDIEIYWDWKTIPRKDEFYDSFICTEVFEHLFDLNSAVSEIYRVLKKWGYWIITLPFVFWEHEIPYDFARYTYFWIEYILKNHWFKIEKHFRIWNSWSTLLQLHRLNIWNFFNKIRIKNRIIRNIFLWPFFILFQILFNSLSNSL